VAAKDPSLKIENRMSYCISTDYLDLFGLSLPTVELTIYLWISREYSWVLHMTKNNLDLNVNVAQSFQFFVFAQVRFQSSSPPFAWLSPRRCFNRRHWNRYPYSSARKNSCSCCPPRCHETAEDDIICAINGHWRKKWWVLCLVSPNGPMGKTNSSSWQIEWGQLHKSMDFNCQICAHIKQTTAFSYYWSSLVMMSKKPCLGTRIQNQPIARTTFTRNYYFKERNDCFKDLTLLTHL